MNMDKINISGDVTLHVKVNFEQPMVKKVPAMNTDTKTIDDDKPGPGRPKQKDHYDDDSDSDSKPGTGKNGKDGIDDKGGRRRRVKVMRKPAVNTNDKPNVTQALGNNRNSGAGHKNEARAL